MEKLVDKFFMTYNTLILFSDLNSFLFKVLKTDLLLPKYCFKIFTSMLNFESYFPESFNNTKEIKKKSSIILQHVINYAVIRPYS